MRSLFVPTVFAIAFMTLNACTKDNAIPESPAAFLFALTNGTDSNAVITYRRDTTDGSLSYLSTTATGGLGTGAPLSSQGPITVSSDGEWLLAVNAASNTLSALRIDNDGPHRVSMVQSGGVRPISITVHNDLVFVLHSGENGTITGFKLSDAGLLTAIEGTKRVLGDSATNPAQVSFALNGSMLVVTLKAMNKIVAYPLDVQGKPGTPISVASLGIFPYGFATASDGTLFVSEGKSGSMSVYKLSATGISAISGPLTTHQNSACWAGLSPNGRHVYILNANSNSITGYSTDRSASYPLLNPDGITASTGMAPIDISFTSNARFAYVLAYGDHAIRTFHMREDGGLDRVEDRYSNPIGTTGICVK
jgi:6-phosphogluconolactonase (cycloisomerase 2 family)